MALLVVLRTQFKVGNLDEFRWFVLNWGARQSWDLLNETSLPRHGPRSDGRILRHWRLLVVRAVKEQGRAQRLGQVLGNHTLEYLRRQARGVTLLSDGSDSL